MQYLTYATEGTLTGAFIQDLSPDHANNHMEVDDATYANWTSYRRVNGALALIPPMPPPDIIFVKTAFIKKVDSDVDAIYDAAIGNRGPEYDQAEIEAKAFKTASYTGTVPASVSSWATAKGWTAQASTDDIIAAATRLTTARDAIRSQRLLRKEQAKAAADATALATVETQWAGFVAYIRGQLGV